jgi:hypothetical protein
MNKNNMNKHFSNSNNDTLVAAAAAILSGRYLKEEQNISGRFKFYASEQDYIESEAATYADIAVGEGTMSWDEAYIENKKRATLNVDAYTGTDDAKYDGSTEYHDPSMLIEPEVFEKHTGVKSRPDFLYGYNADEDVMFSYDIGRTMHYFYTRNGEPLEDLDLF